MKASVIHEYGGPEVLRYEDYPDPVLQPGAVLVRVAAAGVNPVDALERSGQTKDWRPVQFPGVLGWDLSGTVEKLAAGVEGFSIGDQVLAWAYHTYAELCAVSAALLARVRSVHLRGKGRKDRTVPIWQATAAQIRRWIARIDPAPGKPLFPANNGGTLTRSAITDRLKRATKTATTKCASLAGRKISPHTVRHATAMHLLQSGVDITIIALWLGHQSPTTTHIYVEADLKMKEEALKVVKPPALKQVRYQPPNGLLGFLQSL